MKKVLIITYYWPPAGGPGVQRWLKFTKYLPEFGFKPVVFIPENPTYPVLDKSLLAEIPERIQVLKQPIFEPYRFASWFSKKNTDQFSSGIIAEEKNQNFLQKGLLYIRGNLFIPDARKFWVKPSIKYLNAYLTKEKIDQIITTGPPHSLHLIGLGLKQRLNITWIADFRDPWTSIGYHKRLKLRKKSQVKHKNLEALVLNTADTVITTSYTTKKEFEGITTKPVKVITNGFDGFSPPPSNQTTERTFVLSHIGNLLSGRNPRILWKAIAELLEENKDLRESLVLQLVGKISEEVRTSLTENGLDDYLELTGYVSHTEAQQYQEKASLLLLIEVDSPENRGIIAGKLFEYLQAKRPILAIGPTDWDVAYIITATQSGQSFTYSQKQDLKKFILTHFDRFKRNETKFEPRNIDRFHRRQLTKELSILLQSLS